MPLSNYAARDVEALLHPTTNLAAHRDPTLASVRRATANLPLSATLATAMAEPEEH